MSDFFKLPKTRTLLYTLSGILVLLVVFGAGIVVGYRRALFAVAWSGRMFRHMPGAFGPFDAHGVAGEVTQVSTSTITVVSSDGNERTVSISSGTLIRGMTGALTMAEIKAGDRVTILGDPEPDGQVFARFIRVFGVLSPDQPPQNQPPLITSPLP